MMEAALARNGFDRHVERYFDGADEGQRLLCCEILGAIGGSRSFKILLRALDDTAASVRLGAAISLAQAGRLPPLASTLDRLGAKARRSSRLVQVFEEMLATRPQEVRELALDVGSGPQPRIAAVRALVRLWDPEAMPILRALASDPSPIVAMAVARLLGDIQDSNGAPIVDRLFHHHNSHVRRAAAESAGRLAVAELAGGLTVLLDDPDQLTRHSATKALRQLGKAEDSGPGEVEFPVFRPQPAQRQVA